MKLGQQSRQTSKQSIYEQREADESLSIGAGFVKLYESLKRESEQASSESIEAETHDGGSLLTLQQTST